MSLHFDVVSLGELLVEFVRKEQDVMHTVPGDYVGPYPSGAPAITIDTCARLGLRTGFIGIVGDDDFGQMVIERLRSDGVDISRIRVDRNSVTGMAFVAYRSDGSRRFVFNLKYSASAKLSPEHIDPEYVSKARLLHISGSTLYISNSAKGACEKAIDIAKANNITVFLDPNIRVELASIEEIREMLYPIIKNSDAILISEDELALITGITDVRKAAYRIVDLGPKLIAIKRGRKGSTTLTRDGVIIEASAFPISEVDPTGAGDVFNAAFIYGYLNNWNLEKTLIFANAAAAIKVSRRGPMEGPRSYNEVASLILERHVKL
ncbi:MAG: sugar kinase [Ignisphaera sp.]|uniref:Sugar kinase n=1 Tax=Ignisphaera aggregans TaxID=334771 RepID=A0A7J3I7J3_9CREN